MNDRKRIEMPFWLADATAFSIDLKRLNRFPLRIRIGCHTDDRAPSDKDVHHR
jgi:hypothetical protein